MKRILMASVMLVAVQNVMAFGLGDITGAVDKVNETTNQVQSVSDTVDKTTQQVEDAGKAVDKIQNRGVGDTAKDMAVEGSKGAAIGAVNGLAAGTVVKGGTQGAISGAKKGFTGGF